MQRCQQKKTKPVKVKVWLPEPPFLELKKISDRKVRLWQRAQRVATLIKHSIHTFNLLLKKSFLHQQNMNHFPWWIWTSACVVSSIKYSCLAEHRPTKKVNYKLAESFSVRNWYRWSLFIYKFHNTSHSRAHTRDVKATTKKAKQNSVQSTKQNTSMKSKLCCKNSMLRGFICRLRSENSEKLFSRYLHLKNLWAFSRVVFRCPNFFWDFCCCFMARSVGFRNNEQRLHDSRWNFDAEVFG